MIKFENEILKKQDKTGVSLLSMASSSTEATFVVDDVFTTAMKLKILNLLLLFDEEVLPSFFGRLHMILC